MSVRKSRRDNAGPRTRPPAAGIEALYVKALPATRSGPLYAAFPYPTKISPEAIALFIASHTRPGDTVFDGFAGSGTTGLAALLCQNPPEQLRNEAKRMGLTLEWGARNAVLYELGALGAFVANTLTNPPSPSEFRKAAENILAEAERDDGWLYEALSPSGETGTLRYLIWSDFLRCPSCDREVSLWESSVSRDPAQISERFCCPHCAFKTATDALPRVTSESWDDVLSTEQTARRREPVRVCGATGSKNWSRPVTAVDEKLIDRIGKLGVPDAVPRVAIPWGDL